MPQQLFIPVLLMLATALTAALLGLYIWRRQFEVGGNELFLLMMAVAVFAGSYSGELLASSFAQKIAWAKIEYVGIVCISPLLFSFALHYSRIGELLTPKRLLGIWILPGVTLTLAMTNEWHRLIWSEITAISDDPFALLIYSHGLMFWVFWVYSYLLLAAGSILMIRTAWNAPLLYRWQIGLLITGALFPWIGNAVYILGINPWPGLDLTPMTLLITGILIIVGMFRFHTFDITPIAYNLVFNNIGDGVMVTDNQNRIVDINAKAGEWLEIDGNAVGRNVLEVIKPAWVAEKFKNTFEAHVNLEVGSGDKTRTLDLIITPIKDSRGRIQGRAALIHDIGLEQALALAEDRSARQIQMLKLITSTALMTPEISNLTQTLADSLGTLFEADGAFLTLWDKNRQTAIPAAGYGTYREMYPSIKVEPGEHTLTAAVLELGQVIAVENARNNPYISPRLAALFPSESIMGLPLITDNSKLGAALISYNTPHQFSQSEIELGEQAASQIAISLSKARLFEAETKRSNQLEAIQSLTQLVLSSLDLQAIFESIVTILHDTFKYPYVSIYRLNKDVLELGAQIGYPEKAIFYKVPIESGILGRTVRSKQPQFIQDVHQDPHFLQAVDDVQSEICIPLLDGQTVLGTLNIETPADQSLSDDDLGLMITFANQMTIAIRNASLFETEQKNRKLAEALFAATQDFTAGLDTEAVLQAVVKHMVNGLGVNSCAVSRWEREKDCVITLMDYNADKSKQADNPGTMYNLAEFPTTRRVLETGEPSFVTIMSAATDPAELALMNKFGADSTLILPLITPREKRTLGIVELYRESTSSEYGVDELNLARALTAQAAAALENSYLFSEKQRQTILDELTGANNRRGLFHFGEVEFDRATRFQRPFSVIFMDIDHFKDFNDRYSYAVGDQVLRIFSDTVKKNLREFDLIGRYGGEEFVVLLPETDLEMASQAAERVRQAVEDLSVDTPIGAAKFTVSMGVSQVTQAIPNLAALIDRSSQALHEAKSQGRNRVVKAL